MSHQSVWSGRALSERYGLRAFGLFFAFMLCTIVPVDFGTGAAALEAKKRPSSCGREGQRPCKFMEFFPSCEKGLIEKRDSNRKLRCTPGNIIDQVDATAGAVADDTKAAVKKTGEAVTSFVDPNGDPNCGGLGQRGCGTSCDRRLAYHFTKKICVQDKATLIRMAKSLGAELEPVLEMMGRTIIDCGGETIVRGLKARDARQANAAAQRLIDRNCMTVLLEEAKRAGYNTVTVGYGGGAAFIVGGEAEAGIAYDVGFEYFPSAYGVIGYDVGLQAEASPASVVISVYKGNNQPGGFDGDAHGVTWGGKFAVGGGMALWWDYEGAFAGASVAIGSGIEAELAYVRNTTRIYNPLEVIWDNAQSKQIARPTWRPSTPAVSRPTAPGFRPSAPARQPTTTQLALGAAQNVADAFAAAQQAEFERRQRETWFKICNKAKVDGKKVKKLDWALAYWADGSRGGAEGWMSEGWWTLKKGKCQMHNLPNGPDGVGMNYTVMLFGEIDADVTKDGQPRHYSGDGVMFCVRGAKKLRAADQAPCTGKDERLVQGIPFEVGPGGGRFEFRSPGKEGVGYVDPEQYTTGG